MAQLMLASTLSFCEQSQSRGVRAFNQPRIQIIMIFTLCYRTDSVHTEFTGSFSDLNLNESLRSTMATHSHRATSMRYGR